MAATFQGVRAASILPFVLIGIRTPRTAPHCKFYGFENSLHAALVIREQIVGKFKEVLVIPGRIQFRRSGWPAKHCLPNVNYFIEIAVPFSLGIKQAVKCGVKYIIGIIFYK